MSEKTVDYCLVIGCLLITVCKCELLYPDLCCRNVLTYNRNSIDHDPDNSNPCMPYHPLKPDFRAPGRLMTEIKCYERMWELKIASEKRRRSQACANKLWDWARPSPHASKQDPPSIVGGRDAEPGEFPHMGAIGWQAKTGGWVFKCGGSLVSPNFVLTAAHCSSVASTDESVADVGPKIVRFGSKDIVNLDTPPQDGTVIQIITHPQYSSPKKYYDIALMKLQQDLVLNEYVNIACMWHSFDTDILGPEGTVSGWGILNRDDQVTSPVLQVAAVDFIDTATCDPLLKSTCNRNWCGLKDTEICAGKLTGGVDACQGDSGGPLQVKIKEIKEGNLYWIVGVTAFGVDCALPNLPSVYSRVSMFLPWINSVVFPNQEWM